MTENTWLFAIGAAFGAIGFLLNLVVVTVAWAVKREVSTMRESVTSLSQADADLAAEIKANGHELTRLERELAAHKLHAAETYARKDALEALFARLDEFRDGLMAEIRQMLRDVHRRIDMYQPPRGGASADTQSS